MIKEQIEAQVESFREQFEASPYFECSLKEVMNVSRWMADKVFTHPLRVNWKHMSAFIFATSEDLTMIIEIEGKLMPAILSFPDDDVMFRGIDGGMDRAIEMFVDLMGNALLHRESWEKRNFN